VRLTPLFLKLSLVLILSVTGCGYKGPLYLPQDKPAAAKPVPAPAADPSARP
jgi:predicted small lipoprotein YifL